MINRMVHEDFDRQRFISSVAQTFLRKQTAEQKKQGEGSSSSSLRSNHEKGNSHRYYYDHRSIVSFEERRREFLRIRSEHPDRLPVILEKKKRHGRSGSSRERVADDDVPDLDRHKFLVPVDLSVGQFVYLIRRRIRLPPECAIFLFAHQTLPPVGSSVAQVYEEHRDSDGFLYLNYSGERTFG